ncbi:hypothetical protein [Christensenella hongkongensis]|uniref:hypothetical protein n=1 Tax=Christensenella hongkongensis TaxID=270498 RepID=UPI0006235DE6|nr:hypothetical protein [Christensenella hongkongensis]
MLLLPKPVTGIAFEGTRRTWKGISVRYAALLAGARQGGTTKSALHKPLAGNILQQTPILARTTRHILWGALFLVLLPKPVTGIAFEGTRRTGKGITVKYAALLAGARQGRTT